jgi:Ni,Fe-hydrogenase III large subunit
MTSLTDALQNGTPATAHRARPRVLVAPDVWQSIGRRIAEGQGSLVSLWSDGKAVHLAALPRDSGEIHIASVAADGGRFPSIGASLPPATRLERAISDLYGLEPNGAPDRRAWLDHGRWGVRAPLGTGAAQPAAGAPYPFLQATGAPLHQIPVGPVHAGIIEPGHFRFSCSGETVVRLEERLGYVHKGIDGLMRDAPIERAARLAARVSGDSTVAYSLAFARAVEAALGLEVPPRALYLRALMAEIERIANHLGDIGAICNDASFSLMHAHCGVLRERVLRAADQVFGHRLMMDCIIPGGVAADLRSDGISALGELAAELAKRLAPLIELYDSTVSLQDRTVGAGVLRGELARQYGCGGFIGRAAGRRFDARRDLPYPPYPNLRFEVPVRGDGDVNARVWIRVDEVEQSLSLLEQIIEALPAGPPRVPFAMPEAKLEGSAIVEGFRGDVFAWVRLGNGAVRQCHLRDPSWFQWPLLEAAIEGNIVADFPLCNKSFNCSYSGHDL